MSLLILSALTSEGVAGCSGSFLRLCLDFGSEIGLSGEQSRFQTGALPEDAGGNSFQNTPGFDGMTVFIRDTASIVALKDVQNHYSGNIAKVLNIFDIKDFSLYLLFIFAAVLAAGVKKQHILSKSDVSPPACCL